MPLAAATACALPTAAANSRSKRSTKGPTELTKVERDELQVLGLEAAEDLTDETPFNGIGLEQDECAIRHEA